LFHQVFLSPPGVECPIRHPRFCGRGVGVSWSVSLRRSDRLYRKNFQRPAMDALHIMAIRAH
jgi:hypothetical protein